MSRIPSVAFLVLLAGTPPPQIVTYEGDIFPEEVGWERTPFCDPDRRIDRGWLVQHVEVDCGGPPGGDADRYIRSLKESAGETEFFFELRMQTDGDRSEIIGTAPASFVTADLFGVSYHFTMARDQVRFIRDNFLPLIFAEIDPDAPHTYRLELFGAELYAWYIDGQVVDSGVPEGAYPTPTGVLAWRARAWFLDSTTRWDYVRYGTIPKDASGDYDSDAALGLDDFYFFHECLSVARPELPGGPGGNSGPGCRFADFDFDTDTDLRDFAKFQNTFGQPQ